MIRGTSNHDNVICALESSNSQRVVKIQIDYEKPGLVEVKDIFTLSSGQIAGLTSDIQNPGLIYMVDDFQRLYWLQDSGDEKTNLKWS